MNNEAYHLDVEKVLSVLQPGGALSQHLKGYEPREQQQAMLHTVLEAYQNNRIALIEAGTGIGKSIAYLIPAILWAAQRKERTLISTNTITLQEQLLNKDIPLAMQALKVQVKATLVKGMHHYLCWRKLDAMLQEQRLLSLREQEELDVIEQWAEKTEDGTLSDLKQTPSNNMWESVCAEADTCTYRKCPFFKKCHFFRARKEAEDAQILVGNHHLLFADIVYRSKGDDDRGILPHCERIILDEAHNLEEIATQFFAHRVSHMQLLQLLGKLGSEKQGKLTLLKEKIFLHYRQNRPKEVDVILSLLTFDLPNMRRHLLQLLSDCFQVFAQLFDSTLLEEEKEQKMRILPKHLSLPFWKQEIAPHAENLIKACEQYCVSLQQLHSHISALDQPSLKDKTENLLLETCSLANRLEEFYHDLQEFLTSSLSEVRWIEKQPMKTLTNIVLVHAKLNVSKQFADLLYAKFPTTVLCSATMTTNGSFQFFRERLGVCHMTEKEVTANIYPSTFNYKKQALLIVPLDMPAPTHANFIEAACEKIWQAVMASRGNAFVLFTSYAMLQQCYAILAPRFEKNRFSLLRQGNETRSILLEKFKTTNFSVLFGTDSFWQGVDVAGEALRCVIIVKLPFKVPTEPLTQARMEDIANNGGNPFLDYTVPNAIVKFKQGFGRLIRHQHDRGCIVCLDSRLAAKAYGPLFLNSLPPCQQLFVDGVAMQKEMEAFYRKTYGLTKA